GERRRVGIDPGPRGLGRPFDDVLEPQTHLLPRPGERERGVLVAPAPNPRLEDLAGQGCRGPERGGEPLHGRSERVSPAGIPREPGDFLGELEQPQLRRRLPWQPNRRGHHRPRTPALLRPASLRRPLDLPGAPSLPRPAGLPRASYRGGTSLLRVTTLLRPIGCARRSRHAGGSGSSPSRLAPPHRA